MENYTNNKEQYKRLINFIARIIILAGEAVTFTLMWYYCYVSNYDYIFFRRGHWALIGIYVLILFFFTRSFGGYRIGYARMSDVALSQVLALFCANFIEYFQLCMILKAYLNPIPLVCLTLVDLILIFPWIYITRRIFVTLYPPRKMIVVYGDRSPKFLIDKINQRNDKYNICGRIHVSEGFDAITSVLKNYEAVVICDTPSQIRNDILKYCYKHSMRVYVTPKISDIIISGADDIYLFDTPLYLNRNQGLSFDQRFVKRIMDILLSAIILVVFSPLFLVLALLIRLTDGGPVFYTQERLTMNGRSFRIIKFRSMRMDSEKDGARLAMKDDDRITPVGRFMRRTHIDELPQILNIFRGDMSFVGPRPERPEIALEYEKSIPEFSFRLKVKAGLTGYAQVYGKYNTTPYDKLKLDLTYIENYSLWTDFKLILMTMKVIFQKENSEGVDAGQSTALKQ
jgi:exopolysaccharide biosynthesis polyprenyl glycosylphosphotransferase